MTATNWLECSDERTCTPPKCPPDETVPEGAFSQAFDNPADPSWWRQITGALRMKPTFFIVGAQKCGTTALFNYL